MRTLAPSCEKQRHNSPHHHSLLNPTTMPTETTLTRNGVTHSRETQREFRVTSGEVRGRFVPADELPNWVDMLTVGLTQQEIADEVGDPQSRVSEALRGLNTAACLRIIAHYAEALEGPLWYVPEHIDDLAADRQAAAERR